ncbi:GH15 family glucan-1,4-alpha-glucosidase [Arthrobacter sp. V4I6]|uniref:glycoside hydrolase family 15 protein n=1 Tax=unclassified Arthrobacter TaxID=235627 RepID=UPI00277D97F8|nr:MULTISPECIES: glycoside hydrolase family 15 protein [unclassified Arthrobacter]MDQ0820636.1 GH15 family glucan-1,4-alpha-glucosidase [Arthrobacter sp. V1I7]MDQ0854893.1 GH15 family glucan-1,4-alpha-glucosidase [Arthrobacter sp. V4I6]
MSSEPIADYALLSDCCSAALVSAAGSVDWLCFPRFDSPSVFGRVLGPEAGFWSVRPVGEHTSTRRYLGPTMVLETTHTAPGGRMTVTDALVLGDGKRGHDLGADSPGSLLRQVSCTAGSVDAEIVLSARPDYGLARPRLSATQGGILLRAGATGLFFSTPVAFEVQAGTARARVSLRAGDVLGFALEFQAGGNGEPVSWSQADIARRLADTVQGWTSWSEMHQGYQGPWQELVAASGRILQALSYYPTGAIVAAPTTSLPEVEGGTRNWDYRYSWIRDASMTLQALWVAACPDEAGKFFQFLATAAASRLAGGEELQIMFGVGGECELPERELTHLPGWRGSSPVRVGNGACNQRQLDVYGELLDAAATLPGYLAELAPETRRFLADAADAAAARWQDRDHGIWEVRGERRHYLHSKLLCWVAVDRAIGLAGLLQAEDKVPRWTGTRDRIAASIRAEGWSDAANAYTQSYGSQALDASALMLSIVGFLPPDDPGILATIEAIEQRLTDPRGLVYRYRSGDGLPGEEGTFLLCTFWLAHALALAGRTERARAVFERAAVFATDLGLLAEEVAPDSGELLGNFPQAFSHIGLVNAAWAISEAEAKVRGQ